MQNRFTRALVGMRQVPLFLEANEEAVGTVVTGGGTAGFERAMARLEALASAQDAFRIKAAGERANERRAARHLRWTHLRPIVNIAQVNVPALAGLEEMRLPPHQVSSEHLAKRAEAIAQVVVPFVPVLVGLGLRAEFLEELRAAIAALRKTVDTKYGNQLGRLGATSNILDDIAEARMQLGVVNNLVRAALGERHPLLAKWAGIVSRIRRALRTAAGGTTGGVVDGEGTPPEAEAATAPVEAAVIPVQQETPVIGTGSEVKRAA